MNAKSHPAQAKHRVVFPQDFDHRYLFGVTAGHSHSCAIYDDYVRNEVLCWGDNDQRQIGSTSTSNYTLSQWPAVGRTIGDNGVDPSVGAYDEYQTRFAFSGPSGSYSKIAAGGDVTCGIRTSAAAGIACWGVPYVAADAPNTAALITSDTTWAGLTVGPNAACAWKSGNWSLTA